MKNIHRMYYHVYLIDYNVNNLQKIIMAERVRGKKEEGGGEGNLSGSPISFGELIII